MHREHECFHPPEDRDARIWRYMDLPKLLSILDEGRLFFPRRSSLQDPFEGFYDEDTSVKVTEYSKKAFQEQHARLGLPPELDKIHPELAHEKALLEIYPHRAEQIKRFFVSLRPYSFTDFGCINSWHISEHESDAMWNLYAERGKGVAVVSTFSKLCRAFHVSNTNVFIGTVKYIDYQKDRIPFPSNGFEPLLHKRKSFEHERELRAIVLDNTYFEKNSDLLGTKSGVYVPVDIEDLVDAIYIAPITEAWFENLMQNLMRRFHLEKIPIIKSKLNLPPSWPLLV